MKIALFQTKLAWENPEINRTFIEEYFLNEDESFDLFVLPEMFTSGFTMNPAAVAETLEGETMTWLKDLAKKKTCAITGSLVIKENDNFRRFNHRTSEKVYKEFLLYAVGRNLNKYYRFAKEKIKTYEAKTA